MPWKAWASFLLYSERWHFPAVIPIEKPQNARVHIYNIY